MTLTFPPLHFLISAAKAKQFPHDIGAEIAFVGRSNCGKSSALNAICQQKKLARISKTPGRTQLINFFEIDRDHRLVDLPGYGFAKVAAEVQENWQHLITSYLENRKSLRGIIWLMDIRHPFQKVDLQVLDWLATQSIPTYLLLTKSDKLTKNQIAQTKNTVSKKLTLLPFIEDLQSFSIQSPHAVEQARKKVLDWLNLNI